MNITGQQELERMMGKKAAEKPPSEHAPEPLLWTLQTASAVSGVPYTSLRKLILTGHLPRIRLGDSTRDWVKPSDVKRLIERSMVNDGEG